jgi:hypothetical protein
MDSPWRLGRLFLERRARPKRAVEAALPFRRSITIERLPDAAVENRRRWAGRPGPYGTRCADCRESVAVVHA